MKLLLDTQAFIWLINEDRRLGDSTLQLIQDTQNKIWVSYFSFLEMTIKASIGKLNYDSTILEDLPSMGLELIMPTSDVLQCYTIVNSSNRDPFDNLLLAVARIEKAIFLTSDQKILRLPVQRLKLIDVTE